LAPRSSRGRAARLAPALALLTILLAGCGAGSGHALALSVPNGYPGETVHISGNAGPGCVVDKNWFGFSFGQSPSPTGPAPASGSLGGPVAQMATPVAANGSWSATFVVPSYLPGPDRGPHSLGASVVAGKYQLRAPFCDGRGYAQASFQVTSLPAVGTDQRYVAIVATADGGGYWLVQANGKVSAFGDAPWFGQLAAAKARQGGPITGMARTYDGQGYWLVSTGGRVYTFGDAKNYGSIGRDAAAARLGPITGMAATPDGRGYWLLRSGGRVYGFGDAASEGSPAGHLGPYVAIATRPGGGYLVMGADNAAVVAYPGGKLVGGGPGTALAATVVGEASTPSGNGAWLAGADGSVEAVGDAASYIGPCTSQCPSVPANQQVVTAPITGIAATPSGQGYWLLGADGNVYNFGNAPYLGSGYR
jgi:hypothetical protein